MIPHPDLIGEVESAISDGDAERRAALLSRITDLFVLGSDRLTDTHVALFDEVMCRLAAEIEVSARAALARRLANVPNAPLKIIHGLAFDDVVDVACAVLAIPSASMMRRLSRTRGRRASSTCSPSRSDGSSMQPSPTFWSNAAIRKCC